MQRPSNPTTFRTSTTTFPGPDTQDDPQHLVAHSNGQIVEAVPASSPVTATSATADQVAGEYDDVHQAYVYYMADPNDKNFTCKCIHCGQVKVKNVTRQRQHIRSECPVLHPTAQVSLSTRLYGLPHGNAQSARVHTSNTAESMSLGPAQHNQMSTSKLPNGRELVPSILGANSTVSTYQNQNTANGYSIPADGVTMPNVYGTFGQLLQLTISTGPNNMLSANPRPLTSQLDSYSVLAPEQYNLISSTGAPSHPRMLNHEAQATATFPPPSRKAFIIKIEPGSPSPALGPLGQAAETEMPLASIEAEFDDEDSDLDESSSELASGSDDGSDGENHLQQSDADSSEDEEEDGFEGISPFPDDEDEMDDEDVREHGPRSTSPAHGRFGSAAIHKRKRNYKKGKRGPAKHAEPSEEFTALQNEAMRVFIDEQDNSKALHIIRQAIGVNPEFYSAHALLAEIYFAQGEDQKAVDALYLGAHAAPRDPDVWQGVADMCLRLKTIDREMALRQALNCLRRILDIDEDNHDAMFQRALIYHEMGHLNRALREYEGLLEVMPNNTSIIRQQAPLLQELDRVDEAIKVCEDSIAHGMGANSGADDDFSWPDVIVYTDIFARCGQINEAIVKLKRLSRWLAGRETEEYWDHVIDDDREWDAENEPRRSEVINFNPDHFPMQLYGQALPLELRVKLGLYRLTQGFDFRMESLGHFEWLMPEDFTQEAPVYSHPELFLDVANALKHAKEHQEALRYYEALLATEAYSDTQFWLQVAATSFVCEKPEQSRACYEEAKQSDPNCVEARTQLGMLYAGLGDKVKALENAEEAVRMTTQGIEQADRRKYEKKGQKAARKAAERVLKIAKRAERIRKPRPRPPPGPAQLKRKQDAMDKKAQKLAMRIERQTKIYERKSSKRKDAERSNEIRTFRMKELHSHLIENTPAMRKGDPLARTAWLESARQMIEDFCSTDALFPSESQKYNERSENTTDPAEEGRKTYKYDKPDLSADLHTIPSSSWLDIFLETALLHAQSGPEWKGASYALLRSAHDCVAWHRDSAALLQIYTCYFACALELHDEHTLLFTVGRWFMREYRFCTDAYRLFAALNLLYTDADGGKPAASQSGIRDTTTQKFMLRQMGLLDARLPEDYNERGEDGPLPGFMRRTFAYGARDLQDGDDDEMTETVKPKEMDVVMLTLYGHIMYAGDTFVSALNYFYRALSLDPKNPMVLLSIALCYVHELAKRGTEDRHMHVLTGMAVFEEYAEARLQQESEKGDRAAAAARREIEFNRARLWQMLGMSDLALRAYDKLLQAEDDEGMEWSMDAAFAAANIYLSNGDPAMAKHITDRWLVVE